jgi:AcrR family transcriptional regulator
MASSALSPRAREIVDAARELLEAEGEISMRRLAERLGIRAPSIYKHLPDKQALENALISAGFEESAELFAQESDARGLARAYREFALEHPHLYRLMTERPLDRAGLEPGVEERAAQPVIDVFGERARAAWAFAHGMTILELNGRFPPDADLDAAWEQGIDALMR